MPDDNQNTSSVNDGNTASSPTTKLTGAAPVPSVQDDTQPSTPTTTDVPSAQQKVDDEAKTPPTADEFATSSQVPKKYGGKKIIATIFGLLLLVGGVAAGVFLVQRQQEISERAASGKECSQSPDCVLLDNPGNSGSRSFGRIISHIFITARFFHRYEPGETNDGCYHVIIHENSLQWNRVGSGPDCKDISNIQVWLGEEKQDEIEWSISQICDGIKVSVSDDNNGDDKFTVKADFSPSGSPGTWQNEQSWQVNLEDGTYSFNFDPVPTSGWWLRARVIYKDKQVAVIEEPVVDCATPTPTEQPTPTTPPLSARCLDVKIYDTSWNLLSPSDLESLSTGNTIRLAVSGSSNLGFFDKARFIVNGSTLPETSTVKSGSDLFYSEYTIPVGVTSFSINAQLHHSSLGWF